MNKTPNIIGISGNKILVENDGVKYSELLNEFLSPYLDDLLDGDGGMTLDDAMSLAVMAWNLGNLAAILPAEDIKEIMDKEYVGDTYTVDIAKRLFKRKLSKFAKYDCDIADFEFEEVGDELILRVVAVAGGEGILSQLSENRMENIFSENYIDRQAIVVKHKQAIYDWVSKAYPNITTEQLDEDNIYLISDYHLDVEKWLKTNFRKIFIKELEEWDVAKKHWPKRTYKAFNEWFEVSIASMVYDFEEQPIDKG